MNEEQARDLAHSILCVFSEAHLQDNLAKPFIIDMAANKILEAWKLTNSSNGMREVLKKLIFSNVQKDEENPYTYYICFGIYRIYFKGEPTSTLAEMNDYLFDKIEKIAGSFEDES